MRFVSAESAGRSFAGLLDGEEVVPLTGIRELGVETSLADLLSARREDDHRIGLSDVRLRPVVPRPVRIICVGLNYRAHIEENERSDSDYPVLFTKFASSLVGPTDDIVVPPSESHPDFEAEIAVVIGKHGRNIAKTDALDHVAGLTIANDITMRDFQYKTHQWLQGKSWDSTTPLGPAVVTLDEIDFRNLEIRLFLNGQMMQQSNTSLMIFDIPTLVSTISEFSSLEPGDVILTGTPAGIGYRRDPPVALGDGDSIVVEVDGLGRIENRVAIAGA